MGDSSSNQLNFSRIVIHNQVAQGYIYILLNEGYPDLIKIGKSTRQPESRAKELSGTGVFHTFLVAYYEKVSDCDLAERLVHTELKECRPKVNKEFFKISSTEAVRVVQRIAKKVNEEKPFEVKTVEARVKVPPTPTPARWFAVSFECQRCGKYQSVTVERNALKTRCRSCQSENDTKLDWALILK